MSEPVDVDRGRHKEAYSAVSDRNATMCCGHLGVHNRKRRGGAPMIHTLDRRIGRDVDRKYAHGPGQADIILNEGVAGPRRTLSRVSAQEPGQIAVQPQEPVTAQKNPEREQKQKLLAKIREAEGRDPITKAVDAFLAKHPALPDDYEILTKALAHKNADRVRAVLEQLTRLVDREKPRRARALAGQLRFLEDTHPDADIRACACEVRGRL